MSNFKYFYNMALLTNKQTNLEGDITTNGNVNVIETLHPFAWMIFFTNSTLFTICLLYTDQPSATSSLVKSSWYTVVSVLPKTSPGCSGGV